MVTGNCDPNTETLSSAELTFFFSESFLLHISVDVETVLVILKILIKLEPNILRFQIQYQYLGNAVNKAVS